MVRGQTAALDYPTVKAWRELRARVATLEDETEDLKQRNLATMNSLRKLHGRLAAIVETPVEPHPDPSPVPSLEPSSDPWVNKIREDLGLNLPRDR